MAMHVHFFSISWISRPADVFLNTATHTLLHKKPIVHFFFNFDSATNCFLPLEEELSEHSHLNFQTDRHLVVVAEVQLTAGCQEDNKSRAQQGTDRCVVHLDWL